MHMFSKKKLIDYISIFFILSLWFCIDTNFQNITTTFGYAYISKFFSVYDVSLKHFFLSLRSLGPFVFFLILFFLSYFYQFKIKFLTKNSGTISSLVYEGLSSQKSRSGDEPKMPNQEGEVVKKIA